jgi:hypothetical protein
MSETLPSFPVDDVMLDAVEHALGGAYTVDPDGTHRLVGAAYSLSHLLDFLAGYEPEATVPLSDGPIVEYVGGVLYRPDDIIRALIAEVRRLRKGDQFGSQGGSDATP